MLVFYVNLKDDVRIVDGGIKSITVDELIVRNSEDEIVATIGKINENGLITVRDKYGRLITYIGVEETEDEYKARIILGDHYKDFGGLKKEEIYKDE